MDFLKFASCRCAFLSASDPDEIERFMERRKAAHEREPTFLLGVDWDEEQPSYWRKGAEHGYRSVTQVFVGDRPAGFSIWKKHTSDDAHLEEVYVEPEYRGADATCPYSLGTALNMRMMFEMARRGVQRVKGVVHGDNHQMQRVVRDKLGFHIHPKSSSLQAFHLFERRLTGPIPLLDSLNIQGYWPEPVPTRA